MTEGRRLYRSRDALIGGVCAGVADYFDVDPVIVRIFVVIFTIASGGLLGVAYAALCLVLPKEPKIEAPLDVRPQSVHSETYGEVDASRAASPAEAASWRYVSPYATTGHVPPPPPSAAGPVPPPSYPVVPPSYGGWPAAEVSSHAQQAPQPHAPYAQQPPYAQQAQHAQQPYAQPPQYSAPAPTAVPIPTPAGGSSPKAQTSKGVKAALWLGSFLLFFGVVSLGTTFVQGVLWWQYWPLLFVILGIVRMVVPAEPGHRMRHFVDGLTCFFAGVTLLLMSLGIVAWESLEVMLTSLWPLLLMMLGLLVLGGALKSPLITLLGGVCFAAFCVIGLGWYSIPGDAQQIIITAPYGRDYYLYIQ